MKRSHWPINGITLANKNIAPANKTVTPTNESATLTNEPVAPANETVTPTNETVCAGAGRLHGRRQAHRTRRGGSPVRADREQGPRSDGRLQGLRALAGTIAPRASLPGARNKGEHITVFTLY